MTLILSDACREVSTLLGDLELGTVLTVTTAAQTTITTVQRTESDGHWTGGEVTVAGESQRVISYTTAGGLVTNPFVANIQVGAEYELRKLTGHRRGAIKTLLNQAVRSYAASSWIQLDSRLDLGDVSIFNPNINTLGAQTEYPVPPSMTYVHAVLYQDLDDPTLPWYRLLPSLWTTHGNGTVLISQITDDNLQPVPDASPLKFLGSRAPRQMPADGSRCEIDENTAVYYAAARMCLRLAKGNQDADDFKTRFAEFFQLQKTEEATSRFRLPMQSKRIN